MAFTCLRNAPAAWLLPVQTIDPGLALGGRAVVPRDNDDEELGKGGGGDPGTAGEEEHREWGCAPQPHCAPVSPAWPRCYFFSWVALLLGLGGWRCWQRRCCLGGRQAGRLPCCCRSGVDT